MTIHCNKDNSTSIEFTPVVNDPVQVANNGTLNDAGEIDLNQLKKDLAKLNNFETAEKMFKGVYDAQKWRKGKRYSCYSQGSNGNCPVQMYLLLHSVYVNRLTYYDLPNVINSENVLDPLQLTCLLF
ncbi:hypothetical protein BpHYR1_023031 [Brachionus plicatilis]|uniref:Uncharacterized protein n=1 Tax=Brachionus plicatilis TaxID=10195 RepID=A0A3M7T7Q8_BRAPC|nr:hypothetical protein BpHYR1_023031 [Brachionus plicatilis]